MITRRVYFVLLILTSLAISGCTSNITIKTDELVNAQNYKIQSATTKPIKIAVADFTLKTGKPANVVGEAKTGLFNVPAPIRVEKPANVMISDAIRLGLSGIGHQVVETRDAEYNIEGTVEKLWVEEYATGFSFEYAKAHIIYDVILRSNNGNVLWATTIESFKTSGKSADATADDMPTLKAVIDESISKLLEDASFRHAISK